MPVFSLGYYVVEVLWTDTQNVHRTDYIVQAENSEDAFTAVREEIEMLNPSGEWTSGDDYDVCEIWETVEPEPL